MNRLDVGPEEKPRRGGNLANKYNFNTFCSTFLFGQFR